MITMKIIRRKKRDAGILRLVGPLTAGAGVASLHQLELDLQNGASRDLVCDLSQVDYVDAAGVGELLRLRRQAVARGNIMVLAAVPDKVREILDITCLVDELDMATDMQEALTWLRNRSQARRGISLRQRATTRSASSRQDSRPDETSGYHIPIIVAL